jgi:hypothetical protein
LPVLARFARRHFAKHAFRWIFDEACSRRTVRHFTALLLTAPIQLSVSNTASRICLDK